MSATGSCFTVAYAKLWKAWVKRWSPVIWTWKLRGRAVARVYDVYGADKKVVVKVKGHLESVEVLLGQ